MEDKKEDGKGIVKRSMIETISKELDRLKIPFSYNEKSNEIKSTTESSQEANISIILDLENAKILAKINFPDNSSIAKLAENIVVSALGCAGCKIDILKVEQETIEEVIQYFNATLESYNSLLNESEEDLSLIVDAKKVLEELKSSIDISINASKLLSNKETEIITLNPFP